MKIKPAIPAALYLTLCAALLGQPACASAAVLEEVIDVPVRVKDLYGKEISQPIKVTIFRDDARVRAPYLVLNHGRPANSAEFAAMKRVRYPANAAYFVGLGFVVLVPTRVGYGESGGEDVEYTGRCDGKQYAPAYAAAAQQTLAVLQAAASLPFVDAGRGVVVGQSFGGMTAITLATSGLPGLAGTVNFAGGGGGNPAERPENPCSPQRLLSLYQDYGAAAKVPTLWLYSSNDRFWGPQLPRTWFAAFTEAGGKGEFVQLPSYKDNGHGIFSGNPVAWKPAFEQFLHTIGF